MSVHFSTVKTTSLLLAPYSYEPRTIESNFSGDSDPEA